MSIQEQAEHIARVPYSSFLTLPIYELRELGKEFPDTELKDVAFLFKEDQKERVLEITAKHPLQANGHSNTRSYGWAEFSSHTWKIIKEIAQDIFPAQGYEGCRFWINFLPEKSRVDVTVDY